MWIIWDEDTKLTEDEEVFELYDVYNFDLLYNKFIEGNKNITCYYCNNTSISTILRNIQGELNHHLTTNHQGIIQTFDPDMFSFDNEDHKGFLLFVVNAYYVVLSL